MSINVERKISISVIDGDKIKGIENYAFESGDFEGAIKDKEELFYLSGVWWNPPEIDFIVGEIYQFKIDGISVKALCMERVIDKETVINYFFKTMKE